MTRADAGAQFCWYLVVGGSAFVVDVGCFLAFRAAGGGALLASAAGFLVATLANYCLCYRLAFERGRVSRGREILRFSVVALVGLGLNTFFVWLFLARVGMAPVIAKVTAVPLVFLWNFAARRALVFRAELPETTFAASRALSAVLARLCPAEPRGEREPCEAGGSKR